MSVSVVGGSVCQGLCLFQGVVSVRVCVSLSGGSVCQRVVSLLGACASVRGVVSVRGAVSLSGG